MLVHGILVEVTWLSCRYVRSVRFLENKKNKLVELDTFSSLVMYEHDRL